MPTRHVIIGSGIAAVSAAEAIRHIDPGASITMISAEPYPFYSRPALARLLAGEIAEPVLAIRTAEQVEALALERMATHVRAIDPAQHRVTVTNGTVIGYDRLLIATGAETIPLALEGGKLEGVLQLDGVRDANRMLERARSALSAIVLGGGSTAAEIAEGLHARGLATHYVMRGARYWQRVLDAEESGMVEAALERSGVLLRRDVTVARAVGENGRLEGIETADGARLACDLLAVSTGVRPRAALATAAGLQVDRGVVTDVYLATSAPDVFAAGDVAQMSDSGDGRSTLDTLWASAELQGQSAGANMAGAHRPHVRNVPVNVTRLAGIPVTIAGAVGGGTDPDLVAVTRGQSERWDAPTGAVHLAGRRGDDRLRLVVDHGVVIGILAMRAESVARPLAKIIGRQIDPGTMAQVARSDAAQAFDLLAGYCNATLGSAATSA